MEHGTAWDEVGSWVGETTNALLCTGDSLVAGGRFGVLTWDGISWTGLGDNLDDEVYALAEMDSGIIAGGEFTASGSNPMLNIARWDGQEWNALGAGADGRVVCVVVHDGSLYVGGYFTSVDSVSSPYLARWDGQNWHAMPEVPNGPVRTLASFQGQLIAGGQFTALGTSSIAGIASWNGTSWQPLGSGLDFDICCASPIAEGMDVIDGELYVGGWFSTAGGVEAYGFAIWDGTQWKGSEYSNSGNGTNSQVVALGEYNGNLVIGGTFSRAGTERVDRIAIRNGFGWASMGSGTNGTPKPQRCNSRG